MKDYRSSTLLLCLVIVVEIVHSYRIDKYSLLMPNVRPNTVSKKKKKIVEIKKPINFDFLMTTIKNNNGHLKIKILRNTCTRMTRKMIVGDIFGRLSVIPLSPIDAILLVITSYDTAGRAIFPYRCFFAPLAPDSGFGSRVFSR